MSMDKKSGRQLMVGGGASAGIGFVVLILSVGLIVMSPDFDISYLFTIGCGLFLLGFVVLGVGAGMNTSGSSIANRTEQPGTIAVRTPEAVYHYAPTVQPPSVQEVPTEEISPQSPPKSPPQ